VLVSTFLADRLQESAWRLEHPYLRRLLPEPGSR